jgi:hypothetical protein
MRAVLVTSTIRYYEDKIRVRRHWVFFHVRTYQVRAHYAAHRAAEVTAGAEHHSSWAREGWVLLRFAIFGSVSQENHVARDLAARR